jgi:E3 ubiquitin-protein ligase HUWE1
MSQILHGDESAARSLLSDVLGQFAGIFGLSDARIEVEHNGWEPLGVVRHDHVHRSSRRDEALTALPQLTPMSTSGRWQEAAMMFGVFDRSEISGRVLNAIFNNIVPYTLEEDKKAKELEKEIQRKELELRQKREERERKRREEEEEEERRKEEERRREERRREEERRQDEEAAAAGAAVAAAVDAVMTENPSGERRTNTDNQSSTPSGTAPRVFVSISGRDVDITGLGIDPTFLEALPADIREEAFTQHLRELRASGGTEASREIEPEFLDALPDNIREELLAQEAMDSRNQLSRSGTDSHGPVDMDLASFLATLDPPLRQTLLLEQGDATLSALPAEIAQEARELRNRAVASFAGRRTATLADPFSAPRHSLRRNLEELRAFPNESSDEDGEFLEEAALLDSATRRVSKKTVSTASLHLLDRNGIAAVVRVLYLPQAVHHRESLHELLLNLCSNKQSRIDILNIMLHVLQDGSADGLSLEKGFVQISSRAKNAVNSTPVKPGTTPRTPITPKSVTGGSLVLHEDVSPVIVTQQMLEALEYLVRYSGSVKYFFLCEHEFGVGGKRHNKNKKGKEKDSRENKYPINILLNLLERPVGCENNFNLELLTSLIQEVTRSLPVVLKDSDEKGDSDEKEKEKDKAKHKLIDPPYLPDKNLRLISSILTAKECSSRTFQQTLAVMHNLCAIPGIKKLFGEELLEQATSVGPTLISDLKDLLNHVEMAEKGSDLHGVVLSKFSSGSSDQTKLLRVLTAIDYLFNPSRDKDKEKDKSPSPKEDASSYLKSLYEKMTFGPLWGALSDCLRLIQDRQDMIHVATALLPLIEALMVICKNSRVKDVQLRDHTKYEAKKYDIATEPLESLFFSFTDEHRKILNTMVRNNPKLMSGSFSILFKNPKALEFDNKRRYFYRRIYPNNQHSAGTISINVRRDQVFLDSYKALYFKSAEEIKSSRLNIRFQGEEGIDAGGVTREWYQVLSRQIFNPDYALFSPVASDSTTFHPNRTSWVNPEHLSFFKFIGRIIGKAIYDFKLLDCHFSRAVYKKILGKPVSIKDMETLDLDYYKSLVWMLEHDITDIITETFSIEAEDYGEQKIIDLKPGGRDIPVTEENKHEYVRLVVDYRLIKSVQEQLDHFLQGEYCVERRL